jgi:CRP/FNR family cyclic AMP-dependent transcriptional regulator
MSLASSSPDRALAAVPFFARLPAQELLALARLLRPHQLAADQVIFQSGNPGDAFFVLRTGAVKVYCARPGSSEVVLNILGPGECFGELALLDGLPRSASVQTLEPTELWALSREEFLQYLRRYPDAAIAILSVLSEHIRRLSDRVAEAQFTGLAQRVARRLLDVGRHWGEPTHAGIVLPAHATPAEVAALVGASPMRVGLLLTLWQAEGVVELGAGGRLVLRRPDVLESLG